MVVYLGSAALLCLRNYWLLGRGQAIKNYTSVLPIRDLLSLFLRTKNGPFFFFFCSHVSLQTRSCSDTRVHETLSGCGSMIGQHGGGYISGKSFLPLLFLTICNLSFQARRPLKFSGAFFKKGYYRPPLILYHAVHRPASPSFHAPLPLSSHSEAKWEEVRVSERPGTNVWEPSAMPACAFAPDVCSVFFFFLLRLIHDRSPTLSGSYWTIVLPSVQTIHHTFYQDLLGFLKQYVGKRNKRKS